MEIEIGDGIGAEIGTEQECIRAVTTRHRIADTPDQDIRTVATDQHVVSRGAIQHLLAIATDSTSY